MKTTTNERKSMAINVRISADEKQKYMEEARACNMTLSNYVLHILQNKKVTIIPNGEKIAKAMYDLNETLNKCMNNNQISVEEARSSVAKSVRRLKTRMEGV